jgi:hypothetical protein
LSANPSTRQNLPAVSTEWVVARSGDFDGDGRDDLFWRHWSSTTGENVIWKSANPATRQAAAPIPPEWVGGWGDYGWYAF